MRWRGSQIRRWISWLRSLLRNREGDGFESLTDLEAAPDLGSGFGSESTGSQLPRQRDLERKWVRPGLKGHEVRWARSGFRLAYRSLLSEVDGLTLRADKSRTDLQKRRVYKKPSAHLFTGLKTPISKTVAQTAVRSHWSSANKFFRPETSRRQSLDELKLIAETVSKNWSTQALSDSNRHKSATFSPPNSPRLVQKPQPAKPGREPPLWLSLGPHLARQIKQ